MADTINDLYLKYVNSVGSTLEDDRYFRYLFEIVQAGANTLRQNHQVLHKVVDERWMPSTASQNTPGGLSPARRSLYPWSWRGKLPPKACAT